MNPTSTPPRPIATRGFTLIELLVVVGVIAIMLVVAAPSLSSVFKGTKLAQGGEAVRNFLTLAQQTAIKNNVAIEVRFYKFSDSGAQETDARVLGYRMYAVKLDPTKPDPANSPPLYIDPTRLGMTDEATTDSLSITRLPPGIVISAQDTISTLVGTNITKGTEKIKLDAKNPEKEVTYYAFQFNTDGSTNLPVEKKWFLTLMSQDEIIRNTEKSPENFICLQVNAYNGAVRWLQPN